MQSTCKNCAASFEITDEDIAFYKSISPVIAGKTYDIPTPTLCPQCRLQRRLAFINQITVYTRTSSVSGKRIFSMFPENTPFPVYENEYWWSNAWNAHDFGRTIDFSRPFFEQYKELQDAVPRFALMVLQNEDCDYCNNSSQNKHCYLCFNTRRSENCFSCERTVASNNCTDCSDVGTLEHSFSCVSCFACYNLQESQECTNCSSSMFLLNCRSCESCFGCVNLRHQKYCIYNEQKTKEEYEEFITTVTPELRTYAGREEWKKKALTFWLQQPRPHAVLNMTENVSGNYLNECKNVSESFFVRNGENLRFCCLAVDGVSNCYDYSTYGDQVDHVYESARSGNRFVNSAFCYYSYDGCSNLFYCSFCVGCQDCFGCVSLDKKRYCILNKQYTPEEYHATMALIIDHMTKTGEWGEFFPMHMSPNPYNKTSAQRYFPMTKEMVEAKGLQWNEGDMPSADGAIEANVIPDAAPDTQTLIVKSALSGKPFRITTQEIKRYASLGAPLPHTTYGERMEERAARLSRMTLYDRTCAKTGKPIRTAIPPNAPWIVWDKEEYEKEFSS